MATGVSQDDRTMSMVAYLLGIVTWWVGPLIIWLMKKDQSQFARFHALQATFLWGAVTIGYIIGGILGTITLGIGFLLCPVAHIAGIVLSIMAGLAANRGEWYDVPMIGKIVRQQSGM